MIINPKIFSPKDGQSEWCEPDWEKIPLTDTNIPNDYFLIIKNLISPEQCKILIDCYERNIKSYHAKSGDEFWDGRFIWANNLPPEEIDTLRIMQQMRHIATLRILQDIIPQYFVFSDTAQLVKWNVGQELTPHADNIHPDGRPNSTPHRCFSSVLYLNDDYDGGHTYFPGLGARFKPEVGTMIIFGSGAEYVHGVSPLLRGIRYMYAGWFTHYVEKQDSLAQIVL